MSKRPNMEVDYGLETCSKSSVSESQPLAPAMVATVPRVPYKNLPAKDYEDWEYFMRRNAQEIIPGLYLGPYSSASNSKLEELKTLGITHIICVRHIMERKVIRPMHPHDFQYLVIEMVDDRTESLIPHCLKAHKFLNDCFFSGGKALVHGNAGMSRSAALVVAYVMATYGVALKQAMSYVQSKRFSANPSEWFMNQLKEYEPVYQALHDNPHPLPLDGETSRPSLKRELDLDLDTLEIY